MWDLIKRERQEERDYLTQELIKEADVLTGEEEKHRAYVQKQKERRLKRELSDVISEMTDSHEEKYPRGTAFMVKKRGTRNMKEAQFLRGWYTTAGLDHYMWVSRMRSGLFFSSVSAARRIANALDNCEVIAVNIEQREKEVKDNGKGT